MSASDSHGHGDNHGSDPNPQGVSIILAIIALTFISLVIWAFRGNGSSNEASTSNKEKTAIILKETILVSDLMGDQESVTIDLSQPKILDFTREKVAVTTIGRLKVTTPKGSAVLNGNNYEGGIEQSSFNENIWDVDPIDGTSQITFTKIRRNEQSR